MANLDNLNLRGFAIQSISPLGSLRVGAREPGTSPGCSGRADRRTDGDKCRTSSDDRHAGCYRGTTGPDLSRCRSTGDNRAGTGLASRRGAMTHRR